MAALTDAQLTTLASAIQNNSSPASNTHILVGQFLNDIVDSKQNIANLSKIYLVNISQTSTSDPVINTVLKNDFTGTITLSRNATGNYLVTNTNTEFTTGKTDISMFNGTTTVGFLGQLPTSTTVLLITSKNTSNAFTDGIIQNAFLKIIVYP